jgi:hypothetical protein
MQFFETNLKIKLPILQKLAKIKRPIICKSFDFLEKIELMKPVKSQIRQDIFKIMKLNMNAIKEKSDIAKHEDR